MPEQPERDIERQLRASAKQRRAEAGTPFELTDANRGQLQAEVRRRHGARDDRRLASSAWWLALWPRVAFGGAVLAVLGLGLWLSIPTTSKQQPANLMVASNEKDAAAKADKRFSQATPEAKPLANEEVPADRRATLAPATTLAADTRGEKKSEAAAPEPAVRELAVSPTSPAAPPALAPAERQTPVAKSRAVEVATATPQSAVTEGNLPQPTAAGRRGGAGGGGGRGGGGFGGRGARTAVVEQSLADASRIQGRDAETLSATNSLAASGGLARAPGSSAPASIGGAKASVLGDVPLIGQMFRNSAAPTNVRSNEVTARRGIAPARPPVPPAVLNSFRAEQTGDTLRIVDEDGSVYEGKLQVLAEGAALAKAKVLDQAETQTRARDLQLADAAIRGQNQQMPPAINFNVSGVNRSLAQRVVFTGQLQQAISPGVVNGQSNAQFFAPTQGAVPARFSNTPPQQSQQAPAAGQQQRIIGRARLGATPEFEVDAYSTQK